MKRGGKCITNQRETKKHVKFKKMLQEKAGQTMGKQ